MSKLDNVSKLAGFLRWATIAVMILLPIAIAYGLSVTPLTPETLGGDIPVSPDATRAQMITSVMLNLLSPLILLLTLNEMRKLFSAYVKGEILTDRCARIIQRIGQGFLTLAIVSFILQPMQYLLLTMANPPGQRSIAIGLGNEMVFFALSGGLITVIGWAMREASAVASENRSFV